MHWDTTRFRIDLRQPVVMGIVNLTPDSFSDGGVCDSPRAALRHCEQLLREGALMLDLGAESSRPGAPRVPADEEWRRLEPVLTEALSLGVPISVDTCKPQVMQQALDLGADVINDIHALTAPGAEAVLAQYPQAGVCLMHMRGEPASMQSLTQYADVVEEVKGYLAGRANALQRAGTAAARIALDPGLGFAKSAAQNLRLSQFLPELALLGHPVLVGWSRKSTLGWITGRGVGERLAASVTAALLAAQQGAHVLRVHDVAPTVDALRVWRAAGQ